MIETHFSLNSRQKTKVLKNIFSRS